MPKIQVLDQDIANKIAAGEVVERPGSVIKELVENSLDAGAKAITVEIKNGGVTFMRVSDDGCGMSREDARHCFLRHATSKIKNIADLYAIETLGFRGEALAAISSVSKVELITSDGAVGTRLELDAGKEVACDETGAPKGTTIIIRDLFFNTPARMKFLKSDRSESAYIAALIDRLALSNPYVSFKFIQDGKQLLSTDGGGKLLDVIYAVLGRDVTKGMLPVDTTLQQVRVYGYVGEPTVTKNNRNAQLCYINGRLVRSQTVFAAIDQAYRNDLFHGRHAVCVLKITLPYGLVDVNVHPNKMEVKFSNEKLIFEAVYYAIKNALNQQTLKKVETKPQEKVEQVVPKVEVHSLKKSVPAVEVFKTPVDIRPKETSFRQEKVIHTTPTSIAEKVDDEPIVSLPPKNLFDLQKDSMLRETPKGIFDDAPSSETASVKENDQEIITASVAKNEPNFRYVGELFNAFILIEYGDQALLVDKHAAHERMIFERLLKECSDGENIGQQLLVAESVQLSPDELAFAMDNREEFKKLGFDLDAFGARQIILRSRPVCITNESATEAFCEVLNDWMRGGNMQHTERENRALKTIACKAAIKAGNVNDEAELKALVKKLIVDDEIHQCPHGRPVALVYGKKDIEKAFKRI